MCGIAGIVSRDRALFDRLPRMVETLAHRGPDDQGIEILDGAALGHRRLSIIDLQQGHQPMFNPARSIGIVYNGEVYNFRELRQQLEADGAVFATNSDTEVILQLYEKYGTSCVRHLDGMFAFAIWDVPRKRLLLARDHMGQKPLFYCRFPSGIAFASEIKGLLASDLVSRDEDLEALYHYISLRFIPDDLTLFRNIKKLPAAHTLVFEDEDLTVERYWSFSCVEKMSGTESDITDRLDQELERTVESHMVSDVPVGSFLSGGIDSSLITAMMAQSASDPVATFSIGVKEQDFNELPFARLVANQYETDHHERVVHADLVRLLPKMTWHLEEPADPFGVGVYLVSQVAAESVKVVLSGDGGDELFAGYDRFAGQRIADVLSVIPRGLRRTVVRKLINRVPETFAYKSLAQKLRWVNEMSLLQHGERYAQSMSFLRYTEDAKAQLFTEEARRSLRHLHSPDKILAHFNSSNADHLVDRMLYTDLMTRMPDHLLSIVDRMAMAHSLEVRPPLLEHRMVQFAASVPARLKLKGTKLKYILRQVASRHLDASLITRRKQGFGFPIGQWMRGELRELVQNALATSRFVETGTFSRGYVAAILEEHVRGARDHNFRLWIFLNLELWYRMFVEQQPRDEIDGWIDQWVPEKPQAAA